jgi:hypothetical protein
VAEASGNRNHHTPADGADRADGVAQSTTSGDPCADRVDPDDPQEGQNRDSGQGVG